MPTSGKNWNTWGFKGLKMSKKLSSEEVKNVTKIVQMLLILASYISDISGVTTGHVEVTLSVGVLFPSGPKG